jgi:hypothetical protein
MTMKPFASPAVGLLPSDVVEQDLEDVAMSADEVAGGASLSAAHVNILSSSDSPTPSPNAPGQPLSRGLNLTELFQSPRISAIAKTARLQSHDDIIYEFACDEQCSSTVAAILDGLLASNALRR